MNAVVYRIYDATDRLIYIGATSNLAQRLAYHRSASWWWGLRVRVVEESHPHMASAVDAESAAIRSLKPPFNLRERGRWRDHSGLPLTDNDVRTLRGWVAAKPTRSAYLPVSLRWIAFEPALT